MKNFAKGARAFGRYYTLEDTPENEYAFALGDGELDGTTPTGEISLIHRVFKKVLNPLYDPAKDTDNTGTDSAGEKQYIAERAYATEYRGHWLAVTRNVDTAGTVTLDHDFFARWNLTASGTVTLALSNWKDGDSGELIVDTTKQTINIPAEWVTLGADITTTPGVYVLEIHQVNDTIFYGIKCPNQSGGGGGGEIQLTGGGVVLCLCTQSPASLINGMIWVKGGTDTPMYYTAVSGVTVLTATPPDLTNQNNGTIIITEE